MDFYNEHDPFAAAWLRNLITAGLIPDGVVDKRDIQLIQPKELLGYRRCHFFAGIGGWAYALELAGWGDEPVWTGSCPCQPWSDANVWQGGGSGASDPRHLWPAWFRLIRECGPATVLGEQVAAAARRGWVDEVFGDLERIHYACGAAVLPASGVGADHIRRRLWWVADANSQRWEGRQPVERVPVTAPTPLPVARDPFTRARRAVEADLCGLLPCDGVSVQLERDALKGYGNAIVPALAAEFIAAYLESR